MGTFFCIYIVLAFPSFLILLATIDLKSDLSFWFFSSLHSHSHCLKVTATLCHSVQEHLFFFYLPPKKVGCLHQYYNCIVLVPDGNGHSSWVTVSESFLISPGLSVRPQKTHSMRLLKGLTVVNTLWVRRQREIPRRSSQGVKTTKITLLATLKDQRTLAKGLEQHSVRTKHF